MNLKTASDEMLKSCDANVPAAIRRKCWDNDVEINKEDLFADDWEVIY